MNEPIKVKVLQKENYSAPWKVFHRGILVDETSAFVKVFNNSKEPYNYDAEPATAEWFPKDGMLRKCEIYA